MRLTKATFTFFNIGLSPPPPNVRGTNKSSTSILVEWDQLPEEDQNGVIVSYTVTYRALPSNSSRSKNVTIKENHVTLTGLNEYTNYSITVFASTSKGRGNESKPIVVITAEDSKFVIMEFSYYFSLCVLLLSLFAKSFANVMIGFFYRKVIILFTFTACKYF